MKDTNEKNEEFSYGKLAFYLLILYIIVNHVGFVSTAKVIYYNCPGVGLKTNIQGYLGCTEAFTKELNFVWYLK